MQLVRWLLWPILSVAVFCELPTGESFTLAKYKPTMVKYTRIYTYGFVLLGFRVILASHTAVSYKFVRQPNVKASKAHAGRK